jgi:hypothetical protein
MKLPNCFPVRRTLVLTLATAGILYSTHAATILDDTFADGTRNNQNLPTDAAWFVSTPADWTTNVGAMTLAMPSGAIQGIAYFGTNSTSPIHLNVGDTLTATVKFTFNSVAGFSHRHF